MKECFIKPSIDTEVIFVGSHHTIKAFTSGSEGVEVVSGYKLGAVVFLCACQLTLGVGCAIGALFTDAGNVLRLFALLFFILGAAIAVYARSTKGERFYFERRWLLLKGDEVVLANGRCMKRVGIRIKFETSYVEGEQGEVTGWKICFEDADGEVEYHITDPNTYKALQSTIASWKKEILPKG